MGVKQGLGVLCVTVVKFSPGRDVIWGSGGKLLSLLTAIHTARPMEFIYERVRYHLLWLNRGVQMNDRVQGLIWQRKESFEIRVKIGFTDCERIVRVPVVTVGTGWSTSRPGYLFLVVWLGLGFLNE